MSAESRAADARAFKPNAIIERMIDYAANGGAITPAQRMEIGLYELARDNAKAHGQPSTVAELPDKPSQIPVDSPMGRIVAGLAKVDEQRSGAS